MTPFRDRLCGSTLLLAFSGLSWGQTQPQPSSNEQITQAWQQNNVGGQAPQVVQQEDGSTKLEWKGGVAVDSYANDITSANGATNTPLTSGTFYKAVLQSDLRAINGTDVTNFQLGLTQTDDRSVLSQYPRQVNNMQLARAGQGYLMMLGDVAPNFSSLSSALGARGLIAQRQLGGFTVNGYTGVVAESWEALEGRVIRNQYERDVNGVKIDYALTENLKVYATGQSGSDRAGTMTSAAAATAQTAKLRSNSAGFQYQQGQFQMAGETAVSRFEQMTQEGYSGRATVLDGSWRGQTVSLRSGYHDISAGFASNSAAATAGVQETYVGGDWTAAQWVTLGSDLRRSRNSTLATYYTAATTTRTDSGTVRAIVNFGVDHPGWGLTLQQSDSRSFDGLAQESKNAQSTMAVNYSSQTWIYGLSLGQVKARNQAAAGAESDTASWQLSVGRSLSNAEGNMPASWLMNVNLAAGMQHQHLLVGGDIETANYSMSLSAQRETWGTLSVVASTGFLTQASGLPALRQRGLQIEASHPLTNRAVLKLYSRDTRRNIGDPLLGALERVTGVQFAYNF